MDVLTGYINTLKDFYNNYLKEKVLDVKTDPEFSMSAEITIDTINDVIDMINNALKLEGDKAIEHISDPEYVKVYVNKKIEILDENGTKVGELDFTDKAYITVKVGDDVYELTFDDSTAKTFKITFVMTRESGRSYTFDFKAVRSEDGETWYVETNFDIADGEGNVENSTTVRLSDFHGKWGKKDSDRVESLIPTAAQKAAAQAIFPSTNEQKSVGNVLAQLVVDFVNSQAFLEVFGFVGSMMSK